ncbi:MAG: beta-lactamase family protein [Anaerolineae bacterium]|nr:beta-lactamase family protein [Anaerolineae bacterium]
MKIRYLFLMSLWLISWLSACVPAASQVKEQTFLDWVKTSPESQGIDSDKLADMLAAVQAQEINLHSVLIVRNQRLVLEAYYDPYGPNVRHTVESNTKSIIGALVGSAINQGLIKNEDQKLIEFFPGRRIEHLDVLKQNISLKDLLSMTSGLDCEDQTPAAAGMYQTRGWVQYLLDRPLINPPGEHWAYCSGSVHLLSAVLQKVSGMETRAYANQMLFEPLGIAAVEEKDWGGDPQGFSNGIAGLYLTPRELARFGLLYLQQGRWNGKQLVSKDWVQKSTSQQAYIGKSDYTAGMDRRFGYLFSIFPEKEYYGYLGMAGQALFVFPKQNMLVVFTAGLPVGAEGQLLPLVNDYILPSVRSGQALPENPAANQRLTDAVFRAAGLSQPLIELPVEAADISGREITFDPNPYGWNTLVFTFKDGTSEALVNVNRSIQYRMGLDGRYRLTDNQPGRPLGLKARWLDGHSLLVDDISLGEFGLTEVVFTFAGEQVQTTVKNLNFPGDESFLNGRLNAVKN